jgi:hypothetical protein
MSLLCYSVTLVDTGEQLRTRFPAYRGWAAISEDVAGITAAYRGREFRVNVFENGELLESSLYPHAEDHI